MTKNKNHNADYSEKLKCPFCGAELLGSLNEKYCHNRECEYYMRTIPREIWQALIDGKKAQDALKVAVSALKEIQWFCYASTMGERAGLMQQCADKTLQEITSITTQGEE